MEPITNVFSANNKILVGDGKNDVMNHVRCLLTQIMSMPILTLYVE